MKVFIVHCETKVIRGTEPEIIQTLSTDVIAKGTVTSLGFWAFGVKPILE